MNIFDEVLNEELEDTENISDISQQDSIAIASVSEDTSSNREEVKEDIQTKMQIEKKNIVFDPERPFSFVDSMQEQNRLITSLAEKLERIDKEALSGETRGIFWDFKLELESLTNETQKLVNFFSTEIPQQDKELINRTTLLKNRLVEFYDLIKKLETANYDKQIDDVNKKLKRFMIAMQERIRFYDENLKSSFSANLKSLGDLLKDFYNRELENTKDFNEKSETLIADSHKKLKEISSDFEITTKKLKIFGFVIFGAFIALGICFGVLSGFTYLKYTEYKDIESKMFSLSKRLNGITITKDTHNNLILSFPKEYTSLKSNDNTYQIMIKETK